MSIVARVRNSGGVRINRGGGLGLEPSYELICGDPKYLVRLDKLINSSESAKQSLRMEDESLAWKGARVKSRVVKYSKVLKISAHNHEIKKKKERKRKTFFLKVLPNIFYSIFTSACYIILSTFQSDN